MRYKVVSCANGQNTTARKLFLFLIVTNHHAILAFLLSLCRNFGKERFLLFVMHPDDLAFAKYASRLSGIPVKRGDANVFLSHLSCASLVFASRLHAGIAAVGMGIPFYLWEGEEKCRFLIEDIQRLPSGGAFCALFSYNDRPTAWLPSAGIQKAKALLCQRMTENEQAFF